MNQPEVFFLVGTRPEAIKMAPVVQALSAHGRMRPVIVSSGQHSEMIEQTLRAFDLKPDISLTVWRDTGTQAELCSQIIQQFDVLLADRSPAAVLVQGDTTTTLAGALATFWRQIPVVHLEAGLRSGDLASPFPEEGNRKMVGQVTTLHLAPTHAASQRLLDEQITGNVLTVGNTVVDAVLAVASRRLSYSLPALEEVERQVVSGGRRLVLVTAHRRESWGEPMRRILRAVRDMVAAHLDLVVVLPAHPNPAVQRQVREVLGEVDRVLITDPLPYADLARLLSVATLVLSDSGGIQEEAPSFSVPVLVLRDVTERQEAIEAGCARLVGTDYSEILAVADCLLSDEAARQEMGAVGNPFGDGCAARRSEQALAWLVGISPYLPDEFGQE